MNLTVDRRGHDEVKRGVRSFLIITNVLLICSVSANVLLIIKLRKLEKRFLQVENSLLQTKAEHQLNIGDFVPSIAAKDISGSSLIITYAESSLPTILYIFTPECSWCERNLNNLKFLSSQIQSKYRFIGLSLSSNRLRDYVARSDFKFPVYSELSINATTAYKLGGTPKQ